jgi:hypothetical protein
MSDKRHEANYADRNIRYSKCNRTGEYLISMLIPVHDDGQERFRTWTTVLATDFGRMLADGLSPEWIKLDGGPVAAPQDGHFVAIECYLMGATKRQNVANLDGDCYNLRRDNLRLVPETKRSQLAGPYLTRDYPLALFFPLPLRELPRQADRPVLQLPEDVRRGMTERYQAYASRTAEKLIRHPVPSRSSVLWPQQEQAFSGHDREPLKSSTGGKK